jgi:hypothetical protein
VAHWEDRLAGSALPPSRIAGAARCRTARLSALHRGSRQNLAVLTQSGPALHGSGQPIRFPGSQLLADRRRGRPGEFPNRPRRSAKPDTGTALAPLSRSHLESALRRASCAESYRFRDNCQVLSPYARHDADFTAVSGSPFSHPENVRSKSLRIIANHLKDTPKSRARSPPSAKRANNEPTAYPVARKASASARVPKRPSSE